MKKLTKKKLIIIMVFEFILAILSFLMATKIAPLHYSNGTIVASVFLFIYAVAFLIVTVIYYIGLCKDEKEKRLEAESQRNARLKNSRIVEYDPKDIYLLLTEITSSHNDGRGFGPRYVKEYFLAYKEDEELYELFSGIRIEKEEDTHSDGCVFRHFDTPYITEVVPMTKCIKKPEEKITSDLLFAFLVDINTTLRVSSKTLDDFEEEEDDDEVEEN